MSILSLANNSVTLMEGLQTAYYDSGESGSHLPADCAIVLLHGFCGSSAYWENVVPKLEGLGRVIVPDLRGHGGSSAPSGEVYLMESFAEDLSMLISQLQIEHICLFGHSLGGYVSLAFAERYAHRLKSLSLIHSTALPDGETARSNRDKAVQSIRENGIRPFVEGLVPKLFAPEHRESMADRVQRMIEVGSGTSPEGASATALGMKVRTDTRAVLAGLTVPRLLIAGAEDGVIPTENTFTTEGPNVSQVLLSEVGHMGMIEKPDIVGERISAFIRFLSTL
ncbi:alpha/beta hydrolase [Paenibacillus sp. sptzw28]|uniref:alpha/beta fold hydrolase n=1 Tax=Paenibacillus sp. sptzw28 TaxID=715179 RepID=UPI001C6F2AFB|nr:alpha/beta hydrolase [Paenibacillus sp. sptzw28]QYR20572.1 alpha/beta hydrolase [Paenibacillus sp. sptzw28]